MPDRPSTMLFPEVEVPSTAGIAVRYLAHNYCNTYNLFWNTLQHVNEEQMGWCPAQGTQSIGLIVNHVLLMTYVWLAELQRQTLNTTGLLLPEPDRSATRTADQFYADLMMHYYSCATYLKTCTDQALHETVRTWSGHTKEVGMILHEMVMHMEHHRGQLIYIMQMHRFPRQTEPCEQQDGQTQPRQFDRYNLEKGDFWK